MVLNTVAMIICLKSLCCLVDGNYTEWTQWSACYGDFDTKRTRTCQGHQNGGKCHGLPEETRKCGKKIYHMAELDHGEKEHSD